MKVRVRVNEPIEGAQILHKWADIIQMWRVIKYNVYLSTFNDIQSWMQTCEVVFSCCSTGSFTEVQDVCTITWSILSLLNNIYGFFCQQVKFLKNTSFVICCVQRHFFCGVFLAYCLRFLSHLSVFMWKGRKFIHSELKHSVCLSASSVFRASDGETKWFHLFSLCLCTTSAPNGDTESEVKSMTHVYWDFLIHGKNSIIWTLCWALAPWEQQLCKTLAHMWWIWLPPAAVAAVQLHTVIF